MKVVDWRHLGAASLRTLYEREQSAWDAAFGWDTSDTWDIVERARTTWGLPGFVAKDRAGRMVGWTFYHGEGAIRRVGGLVSDSPAATRALLEALLADTRDAELLSMFIPDRAAGLGAVCREHGIELETHHYLRCRLSPETVAEGSRLRGPALPIDPCRGRWTVAAADLLRRAYGTAGAIFAPNNRPDEWIQYVENIVTQPACGRFMPDLSRVAAAERGFIGVALVSLISHRTSHLVQIAVDPRERGRGVARALLHATLAASAASGCTAMTLVVADANLGARRLYEQNGFVPAGRFVAAAVPQPLRSTSEALARGGATTLR